MNCRLTGVTKRSCLCCVVFFFFQAEDGIRDLTVTGVQTCALPICRGVNTITKLGGGNLFNHAATGYLDATGAFHVLVVGGDDANAATTTKHTGDRKSVVWGKSVDLGGRRIIKKKKRKKT